MEMDGQVDARIGSLGVADTGESYKESLLITQPSAVASEDIKERHINTAPHTPEPDEDDGEDELGDDEELDEDDMVSSAVRVVRFERRMGPGNVRVDVDAAV
jgi:hypothetical protein